MSSKFIYAQSYLQFIENKGQWDEKIKFKSDISSGSFALYPTGYRVMMSNTDDLRKAGELIHGDSHQKDITARFKQKDSNVTIRSHAYEVKFLNANPNPVIIPEKVISTYNNYFIGNDANKWASNCKIYTAVTYKNIYPNIDVRYYTDNNNLKYDIIVNPGGDADKIALYFDGVDDLKTKDGNLIIKTSVDDVRELAPYTYQLSKTGKKDVPCSYDVRGNIVRFRTEGTLDKQATLVIDPTLIFVTFTGSTGSNWGYTATYDVEGNFYAGGIVLATGFPVSNGAFQTTYQGGFNGGEGSGIDIGIMKFNSTGTSRLYATYIGGSTGNEQPHSLIVDNNNNLIIAGRTNSSNYPTTLSTVGIGGDWDIVLTKLNATGTGLINSRKIGGSQADGVNIRPKSTGVAGAESIRRNYGDDARSEVIIDNAGNIYLASCTQSINFPTTPGSAQPTPGAIGANNFFQDGVVLKTSPDLSTILFSTFLGGGGDDAAFVLSINPEDGNIFVAGGTTSNNLPGDKTGVIFPTFQGGVTDGYITILNNNGSQFLKTTYIGTNGIDIVFGIQFDRFGFPYIMGTTTAAWPIVSAAFSQPNGKQFVAKLKKDLSAWEFSTVFGTNSTSPNISPFAFLVDRCSNIYVSGWGGVINHDYVPAQTTSGLPVTSGAIKPTTDGSDMYFIVIEKNATSLLYGSFFGQNEGPGSIGEHVDGGTSRFDKNGVIYQSVCANCFGGATFPTTPGVWAGSNGTGTAGCNLAAIKIAFNFSGVGSAVQSSINGVRDTSGCVPLTVTFRDTIANATRYIWSFGDGSPDVTTTAPTVQHTYNLVGDYNIRLVSVDSSSCNVTDTSRTTLRVRNDDASLGFTPVKQLPCDALKYNFINNSVAPGNKPFKPNSFRWVFGDNTTLISGNQTVSHSYAAAGTYIVRLILIDTNYCNEPDSVVQTLRVAPLVKAQFQTSASGCVPYNAKFTNTSLAGTDFVWDFGDGSPISTQVNPTHSYTNIGTYTVKLIATDTNTCNKIDSTSFTITVSANPTSSFTYSPNPPETNQFVNFTNNSSGGTSYKWQFGDGDSLVTPNKNAVVRHIYNASQIFNACLITSNSFGCRDTTCQPIEARIIPLLDVPTAFTPNNDGVNDVVFVQGFGIQKMTWRIYNRWGTLLITSINKATGWDGKYKNVIQPQEVYNYTLEVEFSDGTKFSKKGDITLLR